MLPRLHTTPLLSKREPRPNDMWQQHSSLHPILHHLRHHLRHLPSHHLLHRQQLSLRALSIPSHPLNLIRWPLPPSFLDRSNTLRQSTLPKYQLPDHQLWAFLALTLHIPPYHMANIPHRDIHQQHSTLITRLATMHIPGTGRVVTLT